MDSIRAVRKDDAGFTIIEMMVALVILSIGLLPLFGVLGTGMSGIQRGKATTNATGLAQTELEAARTMDYADIGTSGGNPSGHLASYSEKVVAGITYRIHRYVMWVDDPADGLSPTDTQPQDYKEMKVVVKWIDPAPGGTVEMGTYFRPYTGWNHPPVVSAPTVTPSYPPAVGGYIKDVVTLMATASDDDGTVDRVEYRYKRIGETTWTTIGTATSATGGYWTYVWDTTGLNGTYQVMARAWDNAGADDATYANVTIDNTFPLALIQPASGVITNGFSPIAIVGNAYDLPSAGFSSYRLEYTTDSYAWHALSCSMLAHAGYMHAAPTVGGVNGNVLVGWPVMLLADGTYILRLTVQDIVQHTAMTSQSITLNIPPPKPKAAKYSGGGRRIEWNDDTFDGPPYSIPADLYTFEVYFRPLVTDTWAFAPGFIMPSHATYLGLSPAEYAYQYKVVAVDYSGNRVESDLVP